MLADPAPRYRTNNFSGIVSLLFCGICLKHYAYHNMSRRTQLTTKFTFGLMAQLSENFIFIYLGLSLFTESGLEFKPLFILITVIGICVARWCAVFPLAAFINWVLRYRKRRQARRGSQTLNSPDAPEELPRNYQIMLFWAGLRGAVGVALAAGLQGPNGFTLRATVLVVVVLTVIIFGGTTARMLEILQIRTGVVEEIDSDDEFDIEPVPHSSGGGGGSNAWSRKNGAGFGHTPKASNGAIDLNYVNGNLRRSDRDATAYSTSNATGNNSPTQPDLGRRNSSRTSAAAKESNAEQGLLDPADFDSFSATSSDDAQNADVDLDLPPSARQNQKQPQNQHPPTNPADPNNPYPISGTRTPTLGESDGRGSSSHLTARGAFSQIFNATHEDAGTLFNRLDEGFLKPHLLLDPQSGGRHGHGHGHGHGNGGQGGYGGYDRYQGSGGQGGHASGGAGPSS